MSTTLATDFVREDREYSQLLRAIVQGKSSRTPLPTLVAGLCEGATDAVYASLLKDIKKTDKRTALLIFPEEKECVRMRSFLRRQGLEVGFYVGRDLTFYNITASHEYEHERLKVLSGILEGKYDAIVTTPDAALSYTMPPIRLKESLIKIDGSTVCEPRELCRRLCEDMPAQVEKALELSRDVESIARNYLAVENLFFIGRGLDSALCPEASLKLKEISYIHSEAYAAGELKHGTISLIIEGTPVVALMTQERLCEKMISGIREVKSRGATVLAVTTKEIAEKYNIPADNTVILDNVDADFAAFPLATVIQLFAYHVAAQRGCDVDKPRNLAKSVTVE